jgi:hypothetical protein
MVTTTAYLSQTESIVLPVLVASSLVLAGLATGIMWVVRAVHAGMEAS